MEFEHLKRLSIELADNIVFLETNLRDTSISTMLYSTDEKCEGKKLLHDLCDQWKRVCGELEEANKKDEVEIQEINRELEVIEIYFHDLEEKQKEYEHFLLEKSLLVPDPDELQNSSILPHFDSLEISESCETPASNTHSSSLIPKVTVHSTPHFNDFTYLEDTISEFQSRKNSRKTFVVTK